MAAKYKEKIKKDAQGWKVILFIIAFIVGINFTTQMLSQLENQRLAGYISIAIILSIIVLSFKIISRYVSEYEFILTQSRFKAIKQVGKRAKEAFDIHLSQMEYIVSEERLKTDSRDLKKKARLKQNLTLMGVSRKKMVGFYKDGEDYHSFKFQPSEKMLQALRKGLGEDKVIL